MSDIDNMTTEELTNALNSEIAELNWGWEEADAPVTPKVEAWDDDDAQPTTPDTTDADDDADDADDDADDEQGSSKTERKIKKLLAQRNAERDAKAKLEAQLKELEQKNANTEFYTNNPWAEAHKEAIEKEMAETPWLSMEKAFKIVATWDIIQENRIAKAWNRQIVGTTPWANLQDKKPWEMSTKELDAQVREMYKAWKISI